MRAKANRGAARTPATAAQNRLRRNLYWLGLYTAGLTYEAIAQQSGFSYAAVYMGVRAARHEGRRLRHTMQARESD